MAQDDTVEVKLSNSQLNKRKSVTKKATDIILKIIKKF